jgi:O-antigen/teichoic acid export membrane protein
MEGVGKRLAQGVLWTASTRIVANAIALASTLMLARLLTPTDFGLVAIATTAFVIIGALTEMSLAAALVQHQKPERAHFDTAFTLNVIRALLIAGMLALAARPIAAFYNDERLVAVIYAFCATTALSGFVNPKLVEFNRRLSFKQDFIAAVPPKLLGFIAGLWVAIVYESYWALVIGSIAGQVTGFIVSYALIPYLPRFSLSHARELFSFSIWLVLSNGLNTLSFRSDQLIMGRVLGTDDLGHYDVGNNLARLPVQEATAPIAAVLFPAFSRLQTEPVRLRAAFLRAQRLLVAVGLPVGVGFALVAQPLLALALGPQWAQAVFVVQALSGVLALQSLSAPFSAVAMALKQTRLIFVRDVIFFCVRMPAIFIGLFLGGFVGLVLARCVSGVIVVAMDLALVRHATGARLVDQIGANWRTFAATAAMAGTVAGLSALGLGQATALHLALLVFAGAATYAAVMVGLWRATGKPAGPVQEALDMVAHVRRRFFDPRHEGAA